MLLTPQKWLNKENFKNLDSIALVMLGEGFLREFKGKNIQLKGVDFLAEPSDDGSVPFGSIYFVHGLSGCWDDYVNLLVPLSEYFNIYAYNQRGHGNSPGKYSASSAADDLEEIINRSTGPVGILAHSVGCYTAAEVAKRFEGNDWVLNGVFMIEPYLGMDFLCDSKRCAVRLLNKLAPALKLVDRFLNSNEPLRERLGFKQRNAIETYSSLVNFDSEQLKGLKTDVAFMLSDNDEVLGTYDQAHYFACISRLRELFNYLDYSGHVIGLNHCLNKERGDFDPFLKPRYPGQKDLRKDMENILDRIYRFFKYVFEKH